MNEIQTIIQQSENEINSSGIVLKNQYIVIIIKNVMKHSEIDLNGISFVNSKIV